MRRCPSCGEENSDRARFCQNCATPFAEEAEPAAEVRKVVTIVFADVTGSTDLGERLDPEALRRVMGRYFDEMSAVVERHGGTVEKFIGDAVMAVFGIPRLHEDDALRAVRAAEGMRSALEALNRDLERDHGVGLAARIGVNTGEVVAGDPASGQRLVTGDAVNVAARFEQTAAPGEILLGESTHELVKDAVRVEPVEPLDLKGKAEPVGAFRLIGVSEDTAGHARHLDSEMVGRRKELEMLERALDRVQTERSSHLFTLLGPAGVGKSRLVHEFVTGPATSATVLQGRCLSYGEGITYFPLVQVVQAAAGVERTDDLAMALSKLTALAEGSEDRDRIVSLVAALLSWGNPVAAEEAYWGVRKLFEHLASREPLVVIFDDIHWAEPAFLELIEHLADWTRDAPLLLLCVARPELLELRQDWAGGKLNASTILLEPLASDEVGRLVDNLLGRADIPVTARARILEAAEGNPLFVEEMLGMLIDDGLLRFEGGEWRAVEDLANVTVPPTIQLLLAARLDRLDAEERAVIERGAVEGKVFHAGAVTTLAPEAMRGRVRPRLLALARKELIRPDRAEFEGEDAFRFRHLLIRDAAYHAMPKEQRADLHQRFAAWLERVAGERVAEYEEILAYHLEQAYRYRVELGPPDERARSLARDATARLLSSAERADERGDFATARLLLGRCVEISEGGERSHALTTLAWVLVELNDFQGALDTAVLAVANAEEAGDESEALRAELVRIEARGHVDPTYTIGRAMDDSESVLQRLEEIGDQEGIVRALLAIGQIAFWLGRCAEAREIAERLFEPARTMSYGTRQQVTANLMVYAYFGPGTVDEGFELEDRSAQLLSGSLVGDALLGTFRVGLLGMQGRAAEARGEARRVLGLWEDLGNPAARLSTSQVLAETEWLLGRPEEAERILRDNIEVFDALGEKGYNSTTSAELASVLCEQGRFDEAEEQAERSNELAADDDFASQAEWRSARALVESSRGEHDVALALLDEALLFLAPTDYVRMIASNHETRGRVLAAAGRIDDARSAYELALVAVERKGVVPMAERLRSQIAALAGQ